jgi:hypothetical protein
MTDIPKEVARSTEASGDIPQSAASMSQEIEAPEADPYVISFIKYNDKMCEISDLTGNKAKRAVETLKKVGTKIRSTADYQRHSVDRIPVKYDGEYKKLFNGLLQQDARIFYFDIEPERTFYVVAITENHLETDKVRR